MNTLKPIAQYLRFLRRLAIAVPPLFFGYLHLEGIKIQPLFSNIAADYLLKTSLIIYYFCWVFGTMFEFNIQELVYSIGNKKREISKKIMAAVFAVVITSVFIVLCWANTYTSFSIALAAFWLIDYLGRLYMVKCFVPKMIQDSYEDLSQQKNYISYFKLKVVERLIAGKWHMIRFLIGIFFITIIIALSYGILSIPYTEKNYSITTECVISLTILCYISAVELFIWWKRLQTKFLLEAADEMKNEYGFTLTKI